MGACLSSKAACYDSTAHEKVRWSSSFLVFHRRKLVCVNWLQGSEFVINAVAHAEVSVRELAQSSISRVDRAPSSADVAALPSLAASSVACTRLLSHQHLRSLEPDALQSALPTLVVLAKRGTALLCLASDEDVSESVHAAFSAATPHPAGALQFVKIAPRTVGHAALPPAPPQLPPAPPHAGGCVFLQVVQVSGHWKNQQTQQSQRRQPLRRPEDPIDGGSGDEDAAGALAEAARSLRHVLGCSSQARAAITAMAADWERGVELVVVLQSGESGRRRGQGEEGDQG